jgi:hypothetical protein
MIFGEDDSRPQPAPQQQITLDASQMETIYANFFALAGSADEVTVYLGANSPMPGAKQPAVRISHRLMLLPQNAKRLLIALQQTVKAHEDRFGPIEIAPQRPPDAPKGG